MCASTPFMLDQFFFYTKETISILAPIIALIIAGLGLQTWKRQLCGKSEYDVARKLLIATYKYREAIQSVRHPFMDISETPDPPENDPQLSDERRKRYYSITTAYNKRWDKVTEARIEVDTELLEAEVLWGDSIKKIYRNLFSVGKKLFIDLRHYLNNISPDSSVKLNYNNDIIYAKLIGENEFSEDDKFTNDLIKSINNIEKELKTHLNRKK